MNSVSGWLELLKSASTSPVASQISVKRKAAVIPTGKPIASAVSERRATPRRRSTTATQRPASGPNSGPTTIAPTIRIGEPSEDPDRGDQAGEDHEDEEVAAQLGALRGAGLDLLPDDGVGGRAARRALGPLRRVGDLRVDLLEGDRAVAGATPSSFRSSITTLASSRATSQRITSPAGLPGRSGEEDQVAGRGRRFEQAQRLLGAVGRDDDPQVDHARYQRIPTPRGLGPAMSRRRSLVPC